MDLLIKHRMFEEMSEEEFYQLCIQNRDLQFERNVDGNIIVMSPTSSLSGKFNNEISFQLTTWNKKTNAGLCFDSSSGFTLPNGAIRSPDASFVSSERWSSLSPEEQKGFARICPDFIIELMSETDTIQMMTQKIEEYLNNGCKLAWIIDPKKENVHIFRQGKSPEIKTGFNQSVSGENVLPGFELDLRELRIH